VSEPGRAADSRCPRCGGDFHCGANDPGPCACTTLVLGAPLLAQLRERYTACLCLRCLHELAAAPPATPAPQTTG
jgi:hypothetical protein